MGAGVGVRVGGGGVGVEPSAIEGEMPTSTWPEATNGKYTVTLALLFLSADGGMDSIRGGIGRAWHIQKREAKTTAPRAAVHI